MPFICSICSEESTRICARCTKDSCNNHLCDKCHRCSDCCECEVALSDTREPARSVFRAVASTTRVVPTTDPEPEPHQPPPDPDPFPDEEPEPGPVEA